MGRVNLVNSALIALARREADGTIGARFNEHVRPVGEGPRVRLRVVSGAAAGALLAAGLLFAPVPWPTVAPSAPETRRTAVRSEPLPAAPAHELFTDLVSLKLERDPVGGLRLPEAVAARAQAAPTRPSAGAVAIEDRLHVAAVTSAAALQPFAPVAQLAEAAPVASPAAAGPVIDKQERPLTAAERAENAFRQGLGALENGHAQEAESRCRAALELDPAHTGARQTLLGLLLDARRPDEAERLMLEGVRTNPDYVAFGIAAARLQAQRGAVAAAIATLEAVEDAGRVHGEFVALHATLLQQLGRHAEAAARYADAIALGNPQPVWFIARGISLRDSGRPAEARVSFQRALDSAALTPELRSYVERQMARRTAG